MSRADRTAIVVVTWNKRSLVHDCLESLQRMPGDDWDVIVVDNASTDGTAEMVRRDFPAVELLVSAENLGGAGGFNRGMQHALDAGYGLIWLLDNDVKVEPDALAALQRVMRERPECGVVGSKIYAAGTGLAFIQELGSFINWETAGIRLNHNGTFDHGRMTDTVEVDYVPACSMLVRTAALEGIELFDPSYFLYWDDIDFCHRVWLAGWQVTACGRSVVHHFSSGERAGTSQTIYYSLRNSLYFIKRYMAGFDEPGRSDEAAFQAAATRRIERAAERAGLFMLLGRSELVEALERGVRDGLALVRGRIDDLAVLPLAGPSLEPFRPIRTLVLVAQRPHIFHQSRPPLEELLEGSELLYLVNTRHLGDLAAMEMENVLGYGGWGGEDFRADSVEMAHYVGDTERVIMLGKDGLFPNVIEAALSLGARETLFVDFYGNRLALSEATLDEYHATVESFRGPWLAALEGSALWRTSAT